MPTIEARPTTAPCQRRPHLQHWSLAFGPEGSERSGRHHSDRHSHAPTPSRMMTRPTPPTRRPRTARAATVRSARLSGLQLVTDTNGRPALIPGLSLHASIAGLGVVSPTGHLVRQFAWSEVETFRADGTAEGADGISRQLVELGAGDRRHRFLVPAADLAAFLVEVGRINPHARRTRRDCCGDRAAVPRSAPTDGQASAPPAARGRRKGPHRRRRRRHRRHRPGGVQHRRRLGRRRWRVSRPTFPSSTAWVCRSCRVSSATSPRRAPSRCRRPPPLLRPAPPSLAGSPALQAHEIFGFAPYWTLPQESGFDVSDLTTIAYFSVDVNGDGTVQNSGPGWTGYESQALADLVTRAHAAGAGSCSPPRVSGRAPSIS